MKLGLPGGMPDAALCDLLLSKGDLTPTQLTDIVAAAARVSAGGKLVKALRDRLMAICMAQKLTERTKLKKRAQPCPILLRRASDHVQRLARGEGRRLP